jgi:hypothetical protein
MEPLVFIVGCARSGTTLLQRILNAHNEVSAPSPLPCPPAAGARDAVGALAEALKDPDPQVRQIAATALKNIGREAREAIPALTVAAKDRVPEVRRAAELALKKIDRKGRSQPRK